MSDLFGGGSSQPNIVIPPQKTPKAFQTIIPQKSYKDLAESIGRTEDEIIRLEGNRQDMVGTAQELGPKQRGIEMQEAASYASSLPAATSPDTSFRGTPREFAVTSNEEGTFDTVAGQKSGAGFPEKPATPAKSLAKEAAETKFKDAKDYYLAAVEKAKKTPKSYMEKTKDPGFAQNPSEIFLPKGPKK